MPKIANGKKVEVVDSLFVPASAKGTKSPSLPPQVCCVCGTENRSDFYVSYNRFNRNTGLLPYCKKCLNTEMWGYFLDIYKGNEQLALHGILRKLDVPYIHSVYVTASKAIEESNKLTQQLPKEEQEEQEKKLSPLFSRYMRLYNSMHDTNKYGNSYLDSEGLERINGLKSFEDIVKVKYSRNIDNNSQDYEVIEYDIDYLIQKFGAYPPEDLAFLEEQYLQWKDKLGKFIYEKSTEMNVILLCIEYLKIRRKSEAGESTKDEIATVQKLMAASSLIEKQTMNSKKDVVLGMEIDAIERKRPIRPVRTDLDDVDGYKQQIQCFAGAMSRALGKENQFTEEFDKVMGEYSLDIFSKPSEDIDG